MDLNHGQSQSKLHERVKMTKYYQHGDVLIKSINYIPKNAKPVESTILAEGESTGHIHRINGGKAIIYMVNLIMYLKVIKKISLIHEEHKALFIPPGNYQIDKVKEYDHFLEEARKVVD
jgi:hypothetical protein